MLLLSLFAAVALALAGVGIYGAIAHVVSQGTRDIGIMMALGATPRRILTGVVRQGMTMTMAGLAIGLVGAAVVSGVMKSLLYGVAASDPATFALVCVLLLAAAGAGCYWPARRAARVDPMLTLRGE
jgi:ABC-type antimicrobial peptide transport system permease subunit